jgi:uncharacterized membrane protein YgaE (UPF0421/DUF939 family)
MSKSKPGKFLTVARFLFALQIALISMVAYVVGKHFTSLFEVGSQNIGALWCAITGIMVFHAAREATWKEGVRRVLGALIGAIVSGFYLSFFPFSPIGIAVSAGIAVLLCESINLSKSSNLAATSVVIIMVISNSNPALNPILNATLRFCEACIGAGIAMLMALLSPRLYPVEN